MKQSVETDNSVVFLYGNLVQGDLNRKNKILEEFHEKQNR